MSEEKKEFSGYPTFRYKKHDKHADHADPHKRYEAKIVHSKEQEEELGSDWKVSPADHGIETCPGGHPLEHKAHVAHEEKPEHKPAKAAKAAKEK